MQIFHPAAPVSSREISPDQQTQHIHCLQRVRVFTSLSILFTASLCIYFHSALTALKKSPQLWCLLHLDPIFHPLHQPFAHLHPHPTPHSLTHPHTHIHTEMLLSMCLFREKWPFVSGAPRHRRSRRLTPGE